MLSKMKSEGVSPNPPLKGCGLGGLTFPSSPNSPNGLSGLNGLRKNILNSYRNKQKFRVSVGKTKWIDYTEFDEKYNLREILNDEIVIEFDRPGKWEELTEKEKVSFKNFAWRGVNFTGINLSNAGVEFEVWEHQGKSPHLHIHNLPISGLSKEKRTLFKKIFIRKYVPLDYLVAVDISLTGTHLIAIEWQNHWKGCYGVKKLVKIFDGNETELTKVRFIKETEHYEIGDTEEMLPKILENHLRFGNVEVVYDIETHNKICESRREL